MEYKQTSENEKKRPRPPAPLKPELTWGCWKLKKTIKTMSITYLVSYQREASLTVLGGGAAGIVMAFGIWIVVEHFVLDAPSYIIRGGCRVSFASFQVYAKSTTVKRLLGLDFKAVRRFCPSLREYLKKSLHQGLAHFSYRLNYLLLVILVNGQGRARHRKLKLLCDQSSI